MFYIKSSEALDKFMFYIIGTEALDKFMFYIIGTEALDKFMFYIIGTEALSTEDFFLDKDKAYSDMQGYKNSKLCNVLMTQSLAKQLDGTNVTCNCVCPGKIICH
jgi:NAD(P)-dependent dehydrogenase (short-subunit alcohol dehydrogenase family)